MCYNSRALGSGDELGGFVAAFREHISVSGMLGVAYGGLGSMTLGFSVDQGCLAAFLTWVAGMVPDVDSPTGKPIRELFGLVAVIVPLTTMNHLVQLGGGRERVLLLAILTYLAIRYGGASMLSRLSVHRGMFHSIPALVIAAELTFLGYGSNSLAVRGFMAGGVGIGYFSHLLLDELYSVQWNGLRVKLSKSAGSALKFTSQRFFPNAFTYGLMFFLTHSTLVTVGLLQPPPGVEDRSPDPEAMRERLEGPQEPTQPDNLVDRQPHTSRPAMAARSAY